MSIELIPCRPYYANDLVLACLIASGDPHSFEHWSGRVIETFANTFAEMQIEFTAAMVASTMGQAAN